jgi:hypothetical protein
MFLHDLVRNFKPQSFNSLWRNKKTYEERLYWVINKILSRDCRVYALLGRIAFSQGVGNTNHCWITRQQGKPYKLGVTSFSKLKMHPWKWHRTVRQRTSATSAKMIHALRMPGKRWSLATIKNGNSLRELRMMIRSGYIYPRERVGFLAHSCKACWWRTLHGIEHYLRAYLAQCEWLPSYTFYQSYGSWISNGEWRSLLINTNHTVLGT